MTFAKVKPIVILFRVNHNVFKEHVSEVFFKFDSLGILFINQDPQTLEITTLSHLFSWEPGNRSIEDVLKKIKEGFPSKKMLVIEIDDSNKDLENILISTEKNSDVGIDITIETSFINFKTKKVVLDVSEFPYGSVKNKSSLMSFKISIPSQFRSKNFSSESLLQNALRTFIFALEGYINNQS